MTQAFPIGPRTYLKGLLPVLLGLLCLARNEHVVVGLALTVVGLVLATSYQGLELDVASQRYRQFHWLLGLRLGSWQRLPKAVRVVLKPHSDILTRSTGSRNGSSRTGRYAHLTLLLSIPGSIIGEVMAEFPLAGRARAVAVGEQLAGLLGVPLLLVEGV